MSFIQNKPNLDQMKKYLENNKRDYQDIWWSIPAGTSSIRFMPPWDSKGLVALQVSMHNIEYKAPKSTYTKYNWTCVNKTFGSPCKICEGLANLANAGVDVSIYDTSRSYYANVLVMYDPSSQDPNKSAVGKLKVCRIPKTVYDWLVSQITNPMIGDITDVNSGIDVIVTKSGTGLATNYTCTLSPAGRTPVPAEILKGITELHNLDNIFSEGFDDETVNELMNSLNRAASAIPGNTQQFAQVSGAYNPNPPLNYNQAAYQPYGTNMMPQMPQPPQAPQMPQPPQAPQNSAPTNPPWNPATTQGSTASIPKSPFGAAAPQPPQAPQMPQMPQATSNQDAVPPPAASNSPAPTCFGKYNEAAVQCVICPHEINCMRSKK